MEQKIYNVLFICTGNSARSIIAESAMNAIGRGRFQAYSAGSFPKGEVNPYAIEVLRNVNYPTEGLRSKSWDEFSQPSAPALDFVFTVCDKAAGEVCPIWPGHPMSAHGGVEDPGAAGGSEEQILGEFRDALLVLKRRIELFTSLPLTSIDRMSLQRELQQIGQK